MKLYAKIFNYLEHKTTEEEGQALLLYYFLLLFSIFLI